MPYPNLHGKHAYDALVTPRDLYASLRAEGIPADLSGFGGVVLCYQNRILDRVVAAGAAGVVERIRGVPGECYLLGAGPDEVRIAVCGRFGIGTAGCLQRDTAIGDLVLCTEAIRDEGVSYHYLPADIPARPSPGLTERLRAALARAETPLHAGPRWTIDAPFRETVEEARHCQALGVRTVEMEAAALFAVAAYRGVEIAAAFTISDSVAELTWTPRFHDPAVDRGLDALFAAARAALLVR